MSKQYPEFIQRIEKSDPKFFQGVANIFDLAMTPGELDSKTKVLIGMALDALAGSDEGVKALAAAARNMGVTEGQISEVLRIVYLVAGNKVMDSCQVAFE